MITTDRVEREETRQASEDLYRDNDTLNQMISPNRNVDPQRDSNRMNRLNSV